MVGRLVYEFGIDQPWHVEVVEMLREDRASVLDSGGGGGGSDGNETDGKLGDKIVGSSLSQVTDPDAQT